MKKKGFTLIELLAVIVLLAIITVIAIPKILDVIEEAEKKAYESSVKLMAHQVKMQYELEYSKEIPEQGITYAFGINGKETYQTNIDEVGELKVKGDKPSSGTITLTQNKRIIINDLVSKNKKWCAKKELNGNVIVGKSKDLNCIINEEEIIVDKRACSLEKEIINEKEYYYIDSESDLYELSKEVNNGTNFEGKIVKLRNNLNMENVKNTCGEKEFNPIGTSTNQFKGTFEGSAKTISNLTINKPDMSWVGLFGYIENSTIKGLNISNFSIKGNEGNGPVVGFAKSSNIMEIVANDIKVSGKWTSGGVVGALSNSNIYSVIVNNVTVSQENMNWKNAGSITGWSDGSVKSSIVANANITNGAMIVRCGVISGTYYLNGSMLDGNIQNNGFDISNLNDISFYENIGMDTYIGGDDDNSGYYFDYNENKKVVLKSTEKDPITFNLKGSGTKTDPYLINSEKDWKTATIKPSEGYFYKLTNDLNFLDNNFYMFGSISKPFKGTLDGNAKTISNVTINSNLTDYVGMLGGKGKDLAATVYGLNLNNFSIKGHDRVGCIVSEAYTNTSISEISLENVDVSGNWIIGGVAGAAYNLTDILVKSAIIKEENITWKNAGAVVGSIENGTVKNSIVENANVTNGSVVARPNGTISNCFYSNVTIADGTIQTTGFDKSNINNLSYYAGKVETSIDGDKNKSGYFFDYDESKNGIYIVKAYETSSSSDITTDSNGNITYINESATDKEAPVCTLNNMLILSNGFKASVTCTDNVEVSSFRSYFDSTTDKAAQTYEKIGNNKKITGTTTTKNYNGTWATTNSVGPWPKKGTCYYFRYGAMDSSGNYSTYVTNSCFKF